MLGATTPACNPIFHKTRLCKFYQMGRCTRMQACKFAHSEEEMMPQPDFRRTRMCPEFCSTGQCRSRDTCAFAHTAQELRADTGRRAKLSTESTTSLLGSSARAGVGSAARATPTSSCDSAAEPAAPVHGLAPQAALLFGQGACIQLQALQVVMPPFLPPLASDSCMSFGVCSDSAKTHGTTQSSPGRELRLSAPKVDFDFSEDAADMPSGKPFSVLPCTIWSRQSTQEGVDDPSMRFSRQSTTETWAAADEQEFADDGLEAQSDGAVECDGERSSEAPRCNSKWSSEAPLDGRAVGAERPSPDARATGTPEHPSLPEIANGFGLSCTLRGTFLEFSEVDAHGPALRRVRSTGDCRWSSF